MKYFFLLFLLSALSFAGSPHQNDDGAIALVGSWKFSSMIYQNQSFPRPNPELNLQWTFFENGTERLYWDHGDAKIFCERWGQYSLENSILREEGVALNPKNSGDCGKDPDMQLPRLTYSRIALKEGKIHLYLKAGNEDLIYVLEKIP